MSEPPPKIVPAPIQTIISESPQTIISESPLKIISELPMNIMSKPTQMVMTEPPLKIVSEPTQKNMSEPPQEVVSEPPPSSKNKSDSHLEVVYEPPSSSKNIPKALPRQKRKQRSGGSFCSSRGCCNRSSRNKTSAHPNRDFMRYICVPMKPKIRKAWLTRMKRDDKSYKPNAGLRVCSDHFFDHDFQENDVARYRFFRLNGDARSLKFCRIRLKPNTLPNTDRVTGRYADPLDYQRELRRRPPPNERGPQRNSAVTCAQQTCSYLNFIPIEFKLLNPHVESNEITARPRNDLSKRNLTTFPSFNRTSSVSTRSKGCQAGSAFIHQTQEITSRAMEVDNFHELEILLGPEDFTDGKIETPNLSDPDWGDFYTTVQKDSNKGT